MYVSSIDFTSATASSEFIDSLTKTGFAVITNPPISANLINEIYNEWRVFFNSEDKHRYLFDKSTQAGYFPITQSELAKNHTVKDIKEFFQYYPSGVYPDNLSPLSKTLYQELSQLGATLLAWLDKHLPAKVSQQLSMPLATMAKESPLTMLRILHYPALQGNEEQDAMRAAPHEDINLLTLLPAATDSGLQVKDRQGNWHDVAYEAGNIIINSGDMLQMATNHFIPATTHRVNNPPQSNNQPRLSMPLFLHPRDEVMLTDTISAYDFLHERRLENKVI